jgi:hypothetical protein
MSFKAVLGNTEFELVVFGVTLAEETRPLRRGVLDTTLCDKVYQ